MSNPKPVAVLIADVHYNIHTLQVADAAMRQAIHKANALQVPLIVAGDLHDTKANLRAECVNAMLATFKLCKTRPYILVGNHCKVNERSSDHALNFLSEVAWIEDKFGNSYMAESYLFPYYSDPDVLRKDLQSIPPKSRIIMHQGLQGTNSGEYFQDKSAIRPEDVAGHRVISGHYHQRQNIELPDGGLWSYIGNPYTLNYAEAEDPEKGFQVLYSDGSLEFVPTKLRKHVKIETTPAFTTSIGSWENDDLIWVRITGPSDKLVTLTKQSVAEKLGLPDDFRLEMISTDETGDKPAETKTQDETFDNLIEASSAPNDRKNRLKALWRELV